jgi:DNA recombination protein RmuC
VVADQSRQLFDTQAALLDEKTRALLTPIESQMSNLRESILAMRESYTNEKGVVEGLMNQIGVLQQSTTSLASALKSPTARGSWGENQLRNIIELAGMERFCDYHEQYTGGEGEARQRPDVVISLPNGAFLAVDSKAPLAAYQRMQEETNPERREAELKMHVKAMRDHVKALADRKYWNQFPSAPDFVVMFIPGESFVSDALRADPTLLEEAMRQRVLIASPVNLLAVLLAVAKGWQAHAEQVANLGAELYERVGTILGHVTRVGNGLTTASKAYNDLVGSVESRVLVTLRKFKELGVVQDGDLTGPPVIEVTTRAITAGEATPEIDS